MCICICDSLCVLDAAWEQFSEDFRLLSLNLADGTCMPPQHLCMCVYVHGRMCM